MIPTTISYNTVKPYIKNPFKPAKDKTLTFYALRARSAQIFNTEDEFKKNDIHHLRADFCFDDIWQ